MTKAWIIPLVLLIALIGGAPMRGHAADGQTPVENGVWPLTPRPPVVAAFEPPDARWAAGHRGIDLAGRPGQSVLATLSGTVSFAGSVGGKPVVVIDHGTTRTTYEPVLALLAVGDVVPAGAAVGRLLAVGSHCAPAACLHLGWIRNVDDAYLDPASLFGMRPVRLFPWDGRRSAPRAATLATVPAARKPFGDLTVAARTGGEVGRAW